MSVETNRSSSSEQSLSLDNCSHEQIQTKKVVNGSVAYHEVFASPEKSNATELASFPVSQERIQYQKLQFRTVENQEKKSSALSRNALPSIIGGIALWYSSSICLTALNKYLFDILGFNVPLLITFIHFTAISLSLTCVFHCTTHPKISQRNFLKYILPISIFSTLEIAFTNLAYSGVSISAITVIKSSSIVVTYFFSVLAGLERLNLKLFCVVLIIFGSISMTIQQLEIRSTAGLILLIHAVLFAAARWVVVQFQLQYENLSALQLMFLTKPLAGLCIAGPAYVIDLPHLLNQYTNTVDNKDLRILFGLIILSVVLAFLVIFSEFHLVRVTSSLSLTVAGVGKELATIAMSMAIFNDKVTVIPGIGILSSVAGIVAYGCLRSRVGEEKASGALPSSERTLKITNETIPEV